ncbi:perlucin-like protein isoform X2 [Dunckerocampus dactyliophorus]|uniref:perlucin-like protein isoform X2 n=1 Tax=Dunckerocampus dactyliophorus TaxID=161453 RepID=UPI002404E423|nr:perlucin-like protein isoform X2 [Dunckerocampus dactyliophorus]
MTCQIFRGHLVKVQNEEEHNKLLCMMLRVYPRRLHYWVGAERGAVSSQHTDDDVGDDERMKRSQWLSLFQDGSFKRADGSGAVEFAPWAKGQPDNYNNGENCVWMNSGTWGAWNDTPCGAMSSVACQLAM